MIQISGLKIPYSREESVLPDKIVRRLKIRREDLLSYKILRRSLDVRDHNNPCRVYSVACEIRHENQVLKKFGNDRNINKYSEKSFILPSGGSTLLNDPPVIIGSGPAGLFCAYMLAEAGFEPVVIERGKPVEERIRDVERFWETGILDTSSNVQFGEGGAGTFSDGKLNTMVKDPEGIGKEVLRIFVRMGAPEEILTDQHPHIGTDELIKVLRNFRETIRSLGGRFLFEHQVTDLIISDGQLKGVVCGEDEEIPAHIAVAALGHSARDTFQMFYRRNVPMIEKPFAVGLRIEHLQEKIDLMRYGADQKLKLPAAEYKGTAHTQNGRGVYTFCMCPGGYVINASSEEERLAVNGMSLHLRDGVNANSAVVVQVSPDDFAPYHTDEVPAVFDGMQFQRHLEKTAFSLGKGKVPVQRLADFYDKKITSSPGEVVPQIKGGFSFARVDEILPDELNRNIEEGIRLIDRKLRGFLDGDAMLSGVESRTSSPVRILRDENGESDIRGLYPCGEGAGYAGGITSAAMDGIRIAGYIAKRYSFRKN